MSIEKQKLKKIWVAWEDDASIRSKVLAEQLNADLYVLTFFEGKKWLSIPRYVIAVIQTIFLLLIKRPDILVVQNPSIVLAFLAALLHPIFRYRLVIDLHTMYLDLKGVRKIVYKALNGFALNHCHVVVVTNESYGRRVAPLVSRELIVLPDRIPVINFEERSIPALRGKQNILYICTFSEDEPWQEVINSAKFIGEDICLYISGRNREVIQDVPANVVLTGFLPLEEYHGLLSAVNAVMVLTDQEDCLVCGGYEAVSVEKPLILSDKKALKIFFNSGALFTRHEADKIAHIIHGALDDEKTLKNDIKRLKVLRNKEWEMQWQDFLKLLGLV